MKYHNTMYPEPEDIILDILKQICRKMGKKELILDADPYKIHKFFYQQRIKKNQQYLEKFFFNDDPDFPYSPDLELALLRLQDYGYLVRPNPAYRKFHVKIEKTTETTGNIEQLIDDTELVEEFQKTFILQH